MASMQAFAGEAEMPEGAVRPPRVLVAGVGNLFFGDDGFGVEVVRRLMQRPLPERVRVEDFGIRGMDLAYALLDDYEAVVFVDAAPRGLPPGTLALLEPQVERVEAVAFDTHRLDLVKVLQFAGTLGAKEAATFLIACEPATPSVAEAYEDVLVQLSEPVQAAVPRAVEMVETLLARLLEA